MIGSKVVSTYKRKRLSSRTGFAHENGCPNTSSEKHEEEPTYQDPEPKNQGKHPEVFLDDELPSISTDLLPCDNCNCQHQLQFLYPTNKGKRLCTGCLKHQDSLEGRKPSRLKKEIRTLIEDSNSEQMTPLNNSSSREKTSHISIGCCSFVNSGYAHDRISATQIDKGEDLDISRIKSGCIGISMARKVNFEETGSLSIDKSSILRSDTTRESMSASRLITFSRRLKRKKNVDEIDTQTRLVVGEKICSPATTTTSTCKEAPVQVCYVDFSTDLQQLDKDHALMNFFDRDQEKITTIADDSPAVSTPENTRVQLGKKLDSGEPVADPNDGPNIGEITDKITRSFRPLCTSWPLTAMAMNKIFVQCQMLYQIRSTPQAEAMLLFCLLLHTSSSMKVRARLG